MPKWGKKNQDVEADGNAIGLTQAFSPVDGDVPVKRGRHARKPQDDGNAIGLTQAFAPISADGFEDVSDGFSSRGFDDAEGDSWMPDDEVWGRHAKHVATDAEGAEGELGADADAEACACDAGSAGDAADFEQPATGDPAEGKARRGRDKGAQVPAYMRKSRRMRRILTVVVVLLVVLLGAGAFFTWQLVQTAANSASQQVQTQEAANDIQGAEATDTSTAVTKKTTAPDLVTLMGLTQDEAVEALQHGAQVSAITEVNEEGNPVRTEVRVALTTEPSDTRTGTPTVYLGLDEEGLVVQAGYSASTTSLGYGSLSFSDAVRNEHIIEKTLAEIGVTVEEGSVTLPDDKMAYSTYGSDGKTLVKEYCSFVGQAEANGAAYEWSAVLSYDYSTANATGNLADTVRLIYVYVNA